MINWRIGTNAVTLLGHSMTMATSQETRNSLTVSRIAVGVMANQL
jgi:hypothetical protein